jgi:hypothetical protein
LQAFGRWSFIISHLTFIIVDGFAKSRHPGENRGPEVLVVPGFRLSPE